MKPFSLRDFVAESNRIEGISTVREEEVDEHERLLSLGEVGVEDLAGFVAVIADAPLRASGGMDVRVGNHYPPRGGPDVLRQLRDVLDHMNRRFGTPHFNHCRYEKLHPFMDGNGRSGRALWLWQMGGIRKAPLGFLHHFYYQTLDAEQGRGPRA